MSIFLGERLNGPRTVSTTSDDKIVIADSHNNRIIVFTDSDTQRAYDADAFDLTSAFKPPIAAMDSAGTIIVVTVYGQLMTLQPTGTVTEYDTPIGDAKYFDPFDVAVDSGDRIIVVDGPSASIIVFDSDLNVQKRINSPKETGPVIFLGVTTDSENRIVSTAISADGITGSVVIFYFLMNA